MATGYQLKITIQGIKPPIWRRVIVPEHITFCDLDDIIEKLFGWTHSHLYEFHIMNWGMRITGAPIMEDEYNADECIDSWMEEGSRIMYTYDFGDNWEHLIQIEKFVEYEYRYPTVLKSKGTNLIEDCGGVWGFMECKDEAEEFDIDAVNAEFATWVLPVAEAIDDLVDFGDDFDEDWEDEDYDDAEMFKLDEEFIRANYGRIKSLQTVYQQYTKENLVEMAKACHVKGYSKYGKQKLAEWLSGKVLEEGQLLASIMDAEEDAVAIFEEAIKEGGCFIEKEMLQRSLLLSAYGGYMPYYHFYAVPEDVKEKYAQIMTEDRRAQIAENRYVWNLCNSAIYLYGVISVAELAGIYHKYAETAISEEEMWEKLQDVLAKDEFLVWENGYVMDERLAEDDIYMDVLEDQEEIERYLPDEKEEFLRFGICGAQIPNEDTEFFLDYLMMEANLDYAHAALAYLVVQEAIRMNQDDVELLAILKELGCDISKKKKFDKAESTLKKLAKRIRKWEYHGHTYMELNRGVVEFQVKRVRK